MIAPRGTPFYIRRRVAVVEEESQEFPQVKNVEEEEDKDIKSCLGCVRERAPMDEKKKSSSSL